MHGFGRLKGPWFPFSKEERVSIGGSLLEMTSLSPHRCLLI